MIADRDRVLHRAGGNLDSLNDESHSEERHDYRNHRGLEILAPNRFRRALWFRLELRRLVVAVAIENSGKDRHLRLCFRFRYGGRNSRVGWIAHYQIILDSLDAAVKF